MFFTLVRRLRRSRRAHPEQLTDEDEDAIPSVETWNDASSRVLVTSNARDGTCTVSLRAKVDLPPQQLYDVLTSPQNGVIFKGIKRVIDRRVVHAAPGRQTVDVTQEGQWRFLMFRGTFVTRLRVEEDRASHSVVFRQLSPGFMKAFEGRWQLSPFTQETLDEVFDVQHKHKWLGLRKALAAVEHGVGIHRPTASLATLEQSITPAMVPPGPLRALVGRITQSVVRGMLRDLQEAARRISSGELQWPPNEGCC